MAVNGVFLAGTCQAPMDISESCASGSAAAVKVAGLLTRGHIELDPFRARVNVDDCQGEGKCVEACQHQKAITVVEVAQGEQARHKATVNAALCNGCGMCVAACPHGAIQVAGWQVNQFDAMVDALVAEYS
jgi:heterodisulfide reductase subunit A